MMTMRVRVLGPAGPARDAVLKMLANEAADDAADAPHAAWHRARPNATTCHRCGNALDRVWCGTCMRYR